MSRKPITAYLPHATYDPVGKSTGGSVDGFIYNPQLLSTLRQDNFNTAAAVGSPVGMVFDQFVTNTVGSNTVTNGGPFTVTTGWSAGGSATLAAVTGTLKVLNGANVAGYAFQSQTTVVGTTYKVILDSVASAQGCTLQIGTSSSTSTLCNLNVPAGTTGFTAFFTATTTTSFIRLVNTGATTGNFSEWNNISCQSVAGRHLLNQTQANCPILRLSGGIYHLEFSSGQYLAGAPTYTILLPNYLAACIGRTDGGASTLAGSFGVWKSGTAYHRFGATNTSNRATVMLRDPTLGQIQVSGENNRYPDQRISTMDSLAVVGTLDLSLERRLPTSAANSWISSTTETLCAPGINNASLTTAQAFPMNFYGGCGMNLDPGSDRAGIKAWLDNLAGAD